MAESKHTPGPWHYRPNPHDDWGVVRAASPDSLPGNTVAVALAHRYVDDEALAVHRVNGTDPSEPDARLIAAAPDLHRELRGAQCPRPCNHRPDEFEVGQCLDAGECGCSLGAAIAKAEGRS